MIAVNKFSFSRSSEYLREFRRMFAHYFFAVCTVKIDQPAGKRTTVRAADINGISAFEFAVYTGNTGGIIRYIT